VHSLERCRVPILELPLEGELKIDARGDRERSSSRDEVINSNRSEVLVEEHASGVASFRPAEHDGIRIIGRQRWQPARNASVPSPKFVANVPGAAPGSQGATTENTGRI
jgi:hypothetical protein